MSRTGPAHEVREEEKRMLVRDIQERFLRWEKPCGASNLYRILALLLVKQICRLESEIGARDFPAIPSHIAEQVVDLFASDVLKRVKNFQHSEEEGDDILSQILSGVADALKWVNHATAEKQQNQEPERILGAKSPMDQIQYK